jgi:O-antigen/teichoic acid export membrane protein
MIGVLAAARLRVAQSSLARRFLGGAIWSIFGSVISSGITLAMMMFLARLLGKETYGQLVVVQSTLGMVGVFAGFGIGTAAIRYAAELGRDEPERFGRILVLAERTVIVFGLIASFGLFVASQWMAQHVLNAPDLRVPLSIAAIAVLFTALDAYQKSVLIGFESMRAFAIGTVIGAVAGFPIMLLAANQYGLSGAAVGLLMIAIIQFGISRHQMAKELRKFAIKRDVKNCWSERSILWRFALPALLAGVLVSPTHWVANAMLANTPNGYAQLAVLGIAMQWFNVIMFLPGTAGRVVLPILTAHITKNDGKNSRKILLYAMGANAIVAVPFALVVGLLSPSIMSLYGKSFENEYLPLILAAMTATILAIQSPVGNIIVAASRMWLGALMNAGWAFVYISLAYVLVNKGAVGIMVALGIGYVVHATWTFWFALNQFKSKKSV